MKKILLVGFLGLAGAFYAQAQAAEEAPLNELGDTPRWYVSPGVGMMFFEGNQCVDEGLNLVLRLGYDLSDSWSLEGGVSWAPNITGNGRDGSDDGGNGGSGCDACGGGDGESCRYVSGQSVRGLFGDALYHFDRYDRFDPYLAAGFGYYRSNDRVFCEGSEFSIVGPRVGVGAMYHLNDRWSLRADFRTFMALDSTCEFIYTADAGVVYRFGGKAAAAPADDVAGVAAVAALPGNLDTDGDGLTDEEEATIGTNPRIKDTDGDGLTDGEEVKQYKTDPLNPDTDFDGLKDGAEVKQYKTNPLDRDTDKGGVSDGHEVLVDKTDPLDPSDDLMLFELNINFDYDKAVIRPQYYKDLDHVVRALVRNPNATAVIEGHADRRQGSSREYNQRLSEIRAKAVLNYLVAKGAKSNKMTAVGYGFSRPKVQPDIINGNPENRRVEIYIRGAGTNAEKGKYAQ